jgi:hypothetical protein
VFELVVRKPPFLVDGKRVGEKRVTVLSQGSPPLKSPAGVTTANDTGRRADEPSDSALSPNAGSVRLTAADSPVGLVLSLRHCPDPRTDSDEVHST